MLGHRLDRVDGGTSIFGLVAHQSHSALPANQMAGLPDGTTPMSDSFRASPSVACASISNQMR
jgi:hypothetical protein